MAPRPGIATRVARPGRPAGDRTQEGRGDRSVIATGINKGAAGRNEIGEGSTVYGHLQHAAVEAGLQIVVMPKNDVDSIVVRWNEHGGRIESRISHTTWRIMECAVGSRLRRRRTGCPVSAQRASASRFAVSWARDERSYPPRG